MHKTVTLESAYQECQKLTVSHYENFPVASWLLPRALRKHIYPIYAFARHADDLADEFADKAALLEWREMLHRCMEEPVSHPIFLALSDTIRRFQIPLRLFDELLQAFLMDLEKTRYRSFPELLRYCRLSANPVGRIILHLHGYRDSQLCQYSDYICTALQLTNFWQDVKIDIGKERIYIPLSCLHSYGVSETDIIHGQATANFKTVMERLVGITQSMFDKGQPLLQRVSGRLRWELRFTIAGGRRVLDKIRMIDYDVLHQRVKLGKQDWLYIVMRSFNRRKR